MTKRVTATLLTLCLLLSVTACSTQNEVPVESAAPGSTQAPGSSPVLGETSTPAQADQSAQPDVEGPGSSNILVALRF